MPYYSSSNNPGMAQAANSIARIFVGDPEADAKYRDQEVKNSTEYARQKLIAEQTLSEDVRRKTMEAQAAASYANANAANGLADERGRKNKAAKDLGQIFTEDHRDFSKPGGMSVPGDPVAGTPGAGFDLNRPDIAARVVGNLLVGEMDPKVVSSLALMPGQDDATLGRIMTGSGDKIGANDYVSTNDRNTNRAYTVGADERVVTGGGKTIVGLDPAFLSGNSGLQKAKKNRALVPANLEKIKKSAYKDANIKADDFANTVANNPDLQAGFLDAISQGFQQSGGDAAQAQIAGAEFLRQAFLRHDDGDVERTGHWNPFKSEQLIVNPNAQLAPAQQSAQMPAPIMDPNIFTGGENQPLPNLQNVGNNGGWKFLGAQ